MRKKISIPAQSPALSVRPIRALGSAAAAVIGALSGCTAHVPERYHGIALTDTIEGWDIALSAPEAAARELAEWPGMTPEYSRLDAKLAVGDQSSYPLDQWPMTPTPRLERRGYLLIPTDPGTVTYFRRR